MTRKKEIDLLIARYKADIAALEDRKEDLMMHIEILENLIPTVYVWYMWKYSQSVEIPYKEGSLPPQEEIEKAKKHLAHLDEVLKELKQAVELINEEEKLITKRIEELEKVPKQVRESPDNIIDKKITPKTSLTIEEKKNVEMEAFEGDKLQSEEETDWKKVCEDLIKQVNTLSDNLKNSSKKLQENEKYAKALEEEYSKLEEELKEKIKLLEAKSDELISEIVGKEQYKLIKEECASKDTLSAMQGALAEVRSMKESITKSTTLDGTHLAITGDFGDINAPSPEIAPSEEVIPKSDSDDISGSKTQLTVSKHNVSEASKTPESEVNVKEENVGGPPEPLESKQTLVSKSSKSQWSVSKGYSTPVKEETAPASVASQKSIGSKKTVPDRVQSNVSFGPDTKDTSALEEVISMKESTSKPTALDGTHLPVTDDFGDINAVHPEIAPSQEAVPKSVSVDIYGSKTQLTVSKHVVSETSTTPVSEVAVKEENISENVIGPLKPLQSKQTLVSKSSKSQFSVSKGYSTSAKEETAPASVASSKSIGSKNIVPDRVPSKVSFGPDTKDISAEAKHTLANECIPGDVGSQGSSIVSDLTQMSTEARTTSECTASPTEFKSKKEKVQRVLSPKPDVSENTQITLPTGKSTVKSPKANTNMAKKKEIDILIARYKADISALEERKDNLVRQQEVTENLIPAFFLWYLSKVYQSLEIPLSKGISFPQHEIEEEARERFDRLKNELVELQQVVELIDKEKEIFQKRIEELQKVSDNLDQVEMPTSEKSIENLKTEVLDVQGIESEEQPPADDTDWQQLCADLVKQVHNLSENINNFSEQIRESEDYARHLEEECSKLEKELQDKIQSVTSRITAGALDKDKGKHIKDELGSKEIVMKLSKALTEVRSLRESISKTTTPSKDDTLVKADVPESKPVLEEVVPTSSSVSKVSPREGSEAISLEAEPSIEVKPEPADITSEAQFEISEIKEEVPEAEPSVEVKPEPSEKPSEGETEITEIKEELPEDFEKTPEEMVFQPSHEVTVVLSVEEKLVPAEEGTEVTAVTSVEEKLVSAKEGTEVTAVTSVEEKPELAEERAEITAVISVEEKPEPAEEGTEVSAVTSVEEKPEPAEEGAEVTAVTSVEEKPEPAEEGLEVTAVTSVEEKPGPAEEGTEVTAVTSVEEKPEPAEEGTEVTAVSSVEEKPEPAEEGLEVAVVPSFEEKPEPTEEGLEVAVVPSVEEKPEPAEEEAEVTVVPPIEEKPEPSGEGAEVTFVPSVEEKPEPAEEGAGVTIVPSVKEKPEPAEEGLEVAVVPSVEEKPEPAEEGAEVTVVPPIEEKPEPAEEGAEVTAVTSVEEEPEPSGEGAEVTFVPSVEEQPEPAEEGAEVTIVPSVKEKPEPAEEGLEVAVVPSVEEKPEPAEEGAEVTVVPSVEEKPEPKEEGAEVTVVPSVEEKPEPAVEGPEVTVVSSVEEKPEPKEEGAEVTVVPSVEEKPEPAEEGLEVAVVPSVEEKHEPPVEGTEAATVKSVEGEPEPTEEGEVVPSVEEKPEPKEEGAEVTVVPSVEEKPEPTEEGLEVTVVPPVVEKSEPTEEGADVTVLPLVEEKPEPAEEGAAAVKSVEGEPELPEEGTEVTAVKTVEGEPELPEEGSEVTAVKTVRGEPALPEEGTEVTVVPSVEEKPEPAEEVLAAVKSVEGEPELPEEGTEVTAVKIVEGERALLEEGPETTAVKPVDGVPVTPEEGTEMAAVNSVEEETVPQKEVTKIATEEGAEKLDEVVSPLDAAVPITVEAPPIAPATPTEVVDEKPSEKVVSPTEVAVVPTAEEAPPAVTETPARPDIEQPSKEVKADEPGVGAKVSGPEAAPPADITPARSPSGEKDDGSLAAETLQGKLLLKDHLIKAMADQLRELVQNNKWPERRAFEAATSTDPVNTYDFDTNSLLLYLRGEEPKGFAESMKSNEAYSKINPLNVKIIRKVDKDSLMIEWGPPPATDVVGFQIFVNGQFMYWVHSARRNLALLHPLDLKLLLDIAVSPIDGRGNIVSRSSITYKP